MPTADFLVDHIEPDGLVIGRNGYTDVPLGTVFTAIGKSRVDADDPNLLAVPLGKIAVVRLQLTEVHFFRRLIDAIPRGHSAGLRLDGEGSDKLAAALDGKLEREFVHLLA